MKGARQLKPSLYFSVSAGVFLSADTSQAQEGDLKYEFEDVYRYDAKKWRKCCKVCWRQGKTEYCKRHDPRHISMAPLSRSSKVACRFMDALSEELGEDIMHRHIRPEDGLCEGREFKIPHTSYEVDGYVHQTKTVYEFLGNYWHGNPQCFDHEQMNKSLNKSFGTLWTETFERLNEIAARGYTVYYIWEKTYQDWMAGQSEEKSLLKLMTLLTPLDAAAQSLISPSLSSPSLPTSLSVFSTSNPIKDMVISTPSKRKRVVVTPVKITKRTRYVKTLSWQPPVSKAGVLTAEHFPDDAFCLFDKR